MLEIVQNIPYAERRAAVDRILQTIPQERIRMQKVDGRIREMWGVVRADDGLPLGWKAWPSTRNRVLEFLVSGFVIPETNWGFVHVPVSPLDLAPSYGTDPLGDADMIDMLSGLGIRQSKIEIAVQKGEIPELFRARLTKKNFFYGKFARRFEDNIAFRKAFCSAISMACDAKEVQFHSSS